jgi:hypothetical protein
MTPFSLCVYLGKCEKRPGHKKATNLGFRAAFAAIIPPWARSALVTIWFDGTNLKLEREPWIDIGWIEDAARWIRQNGRSRGKEKGLNH